MPILIEHCLSALSNVSIKALAELNRCRFEWRETLVIAVAVIPMVIMTAALHADQEISKPASESGEREFRAFEGFDNKLALDWQPVRPDATHASLTKHAGKLTITTQLGGIFGDELSDPLLRGIQARNIYVIRNPASQGGDFVVTTCIESFFPSTPYQQAGLIVYDDDDNYVKFTLEYNGRTPSGLAYTFVSETNQRDLIRLAAAKSRLKQRWLRMTKRGNRYQYAFSTDGREFTVVGQTAWGNGRPLSIGILAKNGGEPEAGEVDAQFDFLEVRSLNPEEKNDPRYVDQKKLKGNWEVVLCQLSGDPLKNSPFAGLAFADNRVVITEATRQLAMEYTLQATASPKRMVMSTSGGGLVGSLRVAYALDGDTLVICFHPDRDAPVPTELTTKKGDGRWLVTLKRQADRAK